MTVPERAISGGRQQDHQNGSVLQRDGAGPLAVGPRAPDTAYTSKFSTAHARAGGPTGDLGFPVTEVSCGGRRAYACMQTFEGGTIVRSQVNVNTFVVRKIIENEDPRKPLSDSKIVSILQKEGLMLARRTIAKYREELKIPTSNQRKVLF